MARARGATAGTVLREQKALPGFSGRFSHDYRQVAFMGRQPLAENRLPSQRASVETRDLEARIAALEVECTELRDQLRVQTNLRNSAEARVKELTKEVKDLKPPTLDGKRSTIGKLKPQGSPLYPLTSVVGCVVGLGCYGSVDLP